MDYKEEYSKALERAKKGLPIDEVFPELKESEDERIRKKLIEIVSAWKNSEPHGLSNVKYISSSKMDKINKILAWLEKQKEHKPAEWSEEDEKIYQSIMDDTVQENQLNDKQTNWLRDIKYRYFPQPSWKPSEEQMEALARATNRCVGVDDAKILVKLLERLEKL